MSNIGHIRGLKDVKELRLTPNPAYEGEELQRGADTRAVERAPWSCPVSGLEINGKHGFCFPWSCGCVVAARAIKEVCLIQNIYPALILGDVNDKFFFSVTWLSLFLTISCHF